MKQLSVKSRYVCIALLILLPVLCQAEDLYAMGLSLDFNFQRELIYLVSLLLSFVLGCVAGVTHGLGKHTTVLVAAKTFGAVCLGSCLFTTVCLHLYYTLHLGNPLQNIGSVVTGIGFLCAAVIFKEGLTVRGLSTSTSIWCMASIGVACGVELYFIAVVGTVLIVIFHVLPSKGTRIKKDEISVQEHSDRAKREKN